MSSFDPVMNEHFDRKGTMMTKIRIFLPISVSDLLKTVTL